jgi:hypothetical protein
MGSGPSLNKIDVRRLASMHTIAFHRSYVAWEQWGFAPSMYACFDEIGFESIAEEVGELVRRYPGTRFFLPQLAIRFGLAPSRQVLHVHLVGGDCFATDASELTDFGNVGATSLQLLALLGYSRVLMVGVDARYVGLDEQKTSADEKGFLRVEEDPNHFFPGYIRRRNPRAKPDLNRILGQWPRVAAECERVGLRVRNASPGTALECFPLSDFEEGMTWLAGD